MLEADDGVWKLANPLEQLLPPLVQEHTDELADDDLLWLRPSSAIWPLASQKLSKRKKVQVKLQQKHVLFELFEVSKSELNKWQNAAVDAVDSD